MNGNYDSLFDQYVPVGVVLTEIQMSYMKAIIELFQKQEKVKMIDVARLMNKSTGSVHSAMKILSTKGILKTDHSGEITLLLAKEVSTL